MNPRPSSAHCECRSPADEHMDDWLFLSSDSAGPQCLEVSREDKETDDRGKLKSKLVSAWNSVKYGPFICLTMSLVHLVTVWLSKLFCFLRFMVHLFPVMYQAGLSSRNPTSTGALLWSCLAIPISWCIKVRPNLPSVEVTCWLLKVFNYRILKVVIPALWLCQGRGSVSVAPLHRSCGWRTDEVFLSS